ncbi:hypothetical protein Peur_045038 [Populus x canadensis]
MVSKGLNALASGDLQPRISLCNFLEGGRIKIPGKKRPLREEVDSNKMKWIILLIAICYLFQMMMTMYKLSVSNYSSPLR